MTSSVASSFARTSGLRWGRMMIPVPRRIRLVCAARKVSATMGSTMRSPGPSGEGGAWGSGSTTCSPPQSDSKPAVSAARATRAAPSGYEQGPVVIENRPNLSGIAISSRPTHALCLSGLRDQRRLRLPDPVGWRGTVPASIGAGLAKTVAMGAMMLAAYLSVLTAMSMAPVSYVVAAREIGVVVAALLGMLVLREPRSPSRLLAAVVIFSGLVVIAVSR